MQAGSLDTRSRHSSRSSHVRCSGKSGRSSACTDNTRTFAANGLVRSGEAALDYVLQQDGAGESDRLGRLCRATELYVCVIHKGRLVLPVLGQPDGGDGATGWRQTTAYGSGGAMELDSVVSHGVTKCMGEQGARAALRGATVHAQAGARGYGFVWCWGVRARCRYRTPASAAFTASSVTSSGRLPTKHVFVSFGTSVSSDSGHHHGTHITHCASSRCRRRGDMP